MTTMTRTRRTRRITEAERQEAIKAYGLKTITEMLETMSKDIARVQAAVEGNDFLTELNTVATVIATQDIQANLARLIADVKEVR